MKEDYNLKRPVCHLNRRPKSICLNSPQYALQKPPQFYKRKNSFKKLLQINVDDFMSNQQPLNLKISNNSTQKIGSGLRSHTMQKEVMIKPAIACYENDCSLSTIEKAMQPELHESRYTDDDYTD